MRFFQRSKWIKLNIFFIISTFLSTILGIDYIRLNFYLDALFWIPSFFRFNLLLFILRNNIFLWNMIRHNRNIFIINLSFWLLAILENEWILIRKALEFSFLFYIFVINKIVWIVEVVNVYNVAIVKRSSVLLHMPFSITSIFNITLEYACVLVFTVLIALIRVRLFICDRFFVFIFYCFDWL